MSALTANLLMIYISLVWGATFIVVKWALEEMGPNTFVAWRFLISAALMAPLFLKYTPLPTKREWWGGFLAGTTLGLGYICQTIGLQETSAGKAGFITGLYIVMVPVLAKLLFRRQLRMQSLVGVAFATLGLGLLSLDSTFTLGRGDVWVLGCALLFAFQIFVVDFYAPRANTLSLTFVELLVSGLWGLLFALLSESPLKTVSFAIWGIVLFMSIFATNITFWLQMKIQRFSTPTQAALIFSLEAPFAAIFGWWLGGELLTSKEILGCLLMFTGIGVNHLSAELGSITFRYRKVPGDLV